MHMHKGLDIIQCYNVWEVNIAILTQTCLAAAGKGLGSLRTAIHEWNPIIYPDLGLTL